MWGGVPRCSKMGFLGWDRFGEGEEGRENGRLGDGGGRKMDGQLSLNLLFR